MLFTAHLAARTLGCAAMQMAFTLLIRNSCSFLWSLAEGRCPIMLGLCMTPMKRLLSCQICSFLTHLASCFNPSPFSKQRVRLLRGLYGWQNCTRPAVACPYATGTGEAKVGSYFLCHERKLKRNNHIGLHCRNGRSNLGAELRLLSHSNNFPSSF